MRLFAVLNSRYISISMHQANDRRIKTATSWFAFLSAFLCLGNIANIVLSVFLVIDEDDHDQIFGHLKLNYWVNQPFVYALALFTFLQFFSGLTILVANKKSNKTKTIYYSSIIAMLATFGLGVHLVIQAIEYNAATRIFPKNTDLLPQLMPLFWSLEVTATASFLFILPMMIFVFYHHLQRYLKLQRQEYAVTKKSPGGLDMQGWYLSLFLLHALAQVVLIINFYQFSDAQNKVNYQTDNAIDIYTFYLAVALIVELVAVYLLIKDINRSFLSKKQSILLAVLIGLFMMGSLVSEAIMTAELFIQIYVGGDLLCLYANCDSLSLFRWQIMGYTILNLLAVLLLIPFLKLISTRFERVEERDTLLTTQEGVEAARP